MIACVCKMQSSEGICKENKWYSSLMAKWISEYI